MLGRPCPNITKPQSSRSESDVYTVNVSSQDPGPPTLIFYTSETSDGQDTMSSRNCGLLLYVLLSMVLSVEKNSASIWQFPTPSPFVGGKSLRPGCSCKESGAQGAEQTLKRRIANKWNVIPPQGRNSAQSLLGIVGSFSRFSSQTGRECVLRGHHRTPVS